MTSEKTFRAAVVTVSDGVAAGRREDESGPAIRRVLADAGFDVERQETVSDDRASIEALLRNLSGAVSLVVTTGGTGLGPRDVTPEATAAVIDRPVPGLAERMRAAGRASTPLSDLSRGAVGSLGSCLIVNLPGGTKGATESLEAILPALPHALELLSGHTEHDRSHKEHELGHANGTSSAESTRPRTRDAEGRVTATAVKVHGDPPCQVGQKLVVGRNGPLEGTLGCAEFDDAAIADASGVLDDGTPTTRTYTHELGSIEVFLEPSIRRPLLVVISATPVAFKLVRWGRQLGFDPVLVEGRSDRASAPPDSSTQTVPSVEELRLDGDTVAVHTDHDAPDVVDSVAALLRSPAKFIGVMGSARHVGPYLDELRGRGFGDQDLKRIRTPVGIDIGARTAEEIALSILAGVIAERRGAEGGWLDRPERAGSTGGGASEADRGEPASSS